MGDDAMATELYDLAIPPLVRGFTSLSAILAKGEAFGAEHGIAPGDLLASRLADDMAPLSRQIQMASDTGKGIGVRLGGLDPVAMPDTEASFAELQERIAKTLAMIDRVSPDAINGKETALVELQTPGGALHFAGLDYLQGFALPNFYFHVTTAYAILRSKGAPLGKMDYLGAIPLK